MGGFRKSTISMHTDEYGAPKADGRAGYIGISPELREELDVQVGEVVDVTRDNLEEVYRALVVGARTGVVPMTGTLRDLLGLEKTATLDGTVQSGDIIAIGRRANQLVISVMGEADVDDMEDYTEKMKDRTPTPKG